MTVSSDLPKPFTRAEHEARLVQIQERMGERGIDALVVVERSTRSPEPDWPEHLNLEERRAWGETAVWFAGPPLPADEGPLPTGGRPGPGH